MTVHELGFDAIAILQNNAVIRAEKTCGFTARLSGDRVIVHDFYVVPDVLLQDGAGRKKIEVEILLDDVNASGRRNAFQQRRRRVHVGADVPPCDAVHPLAEGKPAPVVHEREAAVVRGDIDATLIGEVTRPFACIRAGGARGERRAHGKNQRYPKVSRSHRPSFSSSWGAPTEGAAVRPSSRPRP